MTVEDTYTAVVDRFEGDQAVLLLEVDGETVDELVVGREELPEDGDHADAVLSVDVRDGTLVGARYDAEETERRSENARDRFDRLSTRPPGDDDT